MAFGLVWFRISSYVILVTFRPDLFPSIHDKSVKVAIFQTEK